MISVLKFPVSHRYLYIQDMESTQRIHLYAFTETGMAQLLQAIRVQRTKSIPREERQSAIKESLYEEIHCEIPRKQIVHLERRSLLRITGILLLTLGALLIATFVSSRSGEGIWKLQFLSICVGITFLIPLGQSIVLQRNQKRCPKLLRLRGEYLMVDNAHFSVKSLQSVSLTSIAVQNNSVFPVQRYLIIQTSTDKLCYWLGSEKSYPNESYSEIYNLFKQAFILRPERLTFVTKRSIWTR